MAELKYKRVLLKLSGEALAGEKQPKRQKNIPVNARGMFF